LSEEIPPRAGENARVRDDAVRGAGETLERTSFMFDKGAVLRHDGGQFSAFIAWEYSH